MGIVERGRLPPSLARALAWARSSALRVHAVGPDEALAPVDDLLSGDGAPAARRAGIRRAAEPAAANVLLVAGPAPDGDPDPLATYHAMPHPKYVVVVGASALGAALLPGVPVDLTVAADDPGADALFEALLDLQDLIVAEDPVARWQAGPARPAPSGPRP
jgi:NADH:ubiquinone oxidoreductase subunit B-like Fe-S oxidoreductase